MLLQNVVLQQLFFMVQFCHLTNQFFGIIFLLRKNYC